MRKKIMRWPLIGVAVVIAGGLDAQHSGGAQPYCAVYSDGPPNCGIPTLQSCEQSILGVGGMCQPDRTAQMRPNLLGDGALRRDLQGSPAPPDPNNSPLDPNWMPPPPGN
jgi:hypothetical protein